MLLMFLVLMMILLLHAAEKNAAGDHLPRIRRRKQMEDLPPGEEASSASVAWSENWGIGDLGFPEVRTPHRKVDLLLHRETRQTTQDIYI